MSDLSEFGKWINETTFLFTGNEDEPDRLPEQLQEYSSVITDIDTNYSSRLILPEWLSEFKALTTLNLKAFTLGNINVLNRIENLKSMSLAANHSSYEEIKECISKLTYLKLENIGHKNLFPLFEATNIQELVLEGCASNLGFINNLSNLTSLKIALDDHSITLPMLYNIRYLKSLEINFLHSRKYNASLYNEFNLKASEIISQCTNLRHLFIHSNIAKSVDFTSLNKIWDLRLISGHLEYLPNEILEISSLLSLIVEDNELKEIPEHIDLLSNLQRLHIIDCNITSIPPSLIHLENLDDLDLSNNRISDIPVELVHMPKLKSFNYSNNPLDTNCAFYENSLLGVFKQIKQNEQDRISIGIIQMPEAIRNAVQEYLVYFDEYYEEVSGNKIGFKVSKHNLGLQIEVEAPANLDILDVQKALAKYTKYLLDKRFDIENEIEVDKLVKDLQILKLTLENKSNHFDQQMKILELRHQITNDENKYLRQIVATFASKDNVFMINQQTSNHNSPKLINNNNINIHNNFSSEAFNNIAEILKELLDDNEAEELVDAAKQVEDSTKTGKRSAIASALSNFATLVTNSIDKAHIFLVDAPEVVEKLKKSLELARTIANTHHFHQVGQLFDNIQKMF